MSATVIRSAWPGKCSVCGEAWTKGTPIVYNGSTRCVGCARRGGVSFRDPKGLIGPPSPQQVKADPIKREPGEPTDAQLSAAREILDGAPAHLRALLGQVEQAARELAFYQCPREAFHAAVLLGRAAGTRAAVAKVMADPLALVGDAPVANGNAAVEPEPGAGVPLDVLDGLINVPEPVPASEPPEAPTPVLAPSNAAPMPADTRRPAQIRAAVQRAKAPPSTVRRGGPMPWES